EAAKSSSVVARLLRGDDVALVSDAGTPTVSDPGGRLIRAAIDAGIRIEPIPGASAVLTALAASGLPTDSFMFLGFPPIRSKDRRKWFARAKEVGGVIVFFEAPHRIRETLDELRRTVGDCEVAVGRELTKVHEQLVRGPISIVLTELEETRGEFTVVASIGNSADTVSAEPPTDEVMAREFGEMTETADLTRRQAISALGRRHGLAANEVYQALERV